MPSKLPVPMGRENPSDAFVVGYMCLTDFRCELGKNMRGNTIYPTVEDCIKDRGGCTDECGIIEVEVKALRIVQEPKTSFG